MSGAAAACAAAAAAGVALAMAGCPRGGVVELDKIEARSADAKVQAQFDAARAAYGAGDYARARRDMAALAAAHPDDPLAPAARVMEGRAALGMGDAAGALEKLEPVAAPPGEVGSGVAAQARYFCGWAELKLGRDADAVRDLEPFRTRLGDPGEKVALVAALAEAWVRLGAADRAVARYGELWALTDLEGEKVYAADQARGLALGALGAEGARRLWEATGKDGGSFAGALAALRLAVEAIAAGRLDEARGLLDDSREMRASLGEAGLLPPGVAEPGEATGAPRGADPRAVGVLLPLSGKAAPLGRSVLRGALAAARAGGLRLVVRDSEAPGGAVKAVDELAAAGVVGILGAPIEATARAAGARAAELRVPFVALTSGSGLSDPARGLFRLFTDAEVDAAAVAGYAVGARGVKKFALLVPDNDYGRRMARAFRDGLARAGAPPDAVVAEVTYGDAVTAFAPEVAKLPAAGWEALFVPDSARRVALIAPALASAGFWAGGPDTPAPKKGRVVLLLLASVGARPELLATSSRYVERALAAVSFHASDSAPETKAFVARWRATEAGADPDVAAAYGYDAAALLGALGASARGARNEVAAALGRLHDAPGLTGPLAAQPDGTLRGPSRIVEVRGESFVVLGKI